MAENPDYSFMKSGFDMTQSSQPDEFIKNATAIMVTFGEQALRTSAIYVSHHKGRNSVTPEDLKRALMLEMFLFNNRPNLLEKTEEIKSMLFGESQESDPESDDEEYMTSKEEPFSESSCSCALCGCINSIKERWEKFKPGTPLENILKKRIDEI